VFDVWALTIAEGRIAAIDVVADPDQLHKIVLRIWTDGDATWRKRRAL